MNYECCSKRSVVRPTRSVRPWFKEPGRDVVSQDVTSRGLRHPASPKDSGAMLGRDEERKTMDHKENLKQEKTLGNALK